MKNSAAISARAAEWWSRVRLCEPRPDTLAAFERWRAADPAHAAAFERTERLWQDLGDVGRLPRGETLLQETASIASAQETLLSIDPRRRRLRYVQAAMAAALFAVAVIPLARWLMSGETYSTQIAEVRELMLPDGSRVTLGARSRIDVDYGERQRRVRLTGGEAFFDVRSSATRPFIVDAGEAQVRVLGTRFNVRRGAQEINVSVLQGAVEVRQDDQLARRLETDQRATLKRSHTPLVEAIERTAPAGDWRGGRLSYDGAPLIEVVADVNRYYPPGIDIDSKELANLQVTAAFEVGQIDLMIDSLTVALPLAAQRQANGHVVLVTKP